MAYIGNSPANVGNYQIVDDISSSFNGSLTSFALASGGITITPAKSGQLLVGVNGVMQEPDDTGTNGFKVSGSNIVFSSAPESGDSFWGVYQGQNVDVGTPSTDTVGLTQLSATGTASSTTFLRGDNTWDVPIGGVTSVNSVTGAVTAAHLKTALENGIDSVHYVDGSIDNEHIADDAIDSEHYAADSIDTEHYAAGSVDATALGADCVTADKIGDDVLNSEHYAAASIDNEHLADDAVGVAELSATGTASSSTFLRGDNTWTAIATDANTTTKGLYEHEHTIDADYSIASGSNAMSAGPITIDTGNSVTVPSGSTWVIV